jgi:ABC-type multidrug transport system ATPase subunit
LTSAEHLKLFCAFKGTPKHEIDGLVEKMIDDIDLTSVKD